MEVWKFILPTFKNLFYCIILALITGFCGFFSSFLKEICQKHNFYFALRSALLLADLFNSQGLL